MSATVVRDWLLLALSLFNTLVPVWLGLTVLLNGKQAQAPGGRWGFWLASAGLLAGATFFAGHAIILSTGLDGAGIDFWWRMGWLLLILMPCGWYVLMLWYGSFWEQWRLGAQRHQLAAVSCCTALALGMAGLLLLADPLPPLAQGAALRLAELRTPAFLALAYGYPLYNLLAIGFSLDALRRPMPAARLMGDLARDRARPWLAATAAVLLAVSLLVTALMTWGLAGRAATLDLEAMLWFDLLISMLVSAAIVLLGQALIAYEVFTGQVLPRRAFARQWRRALILAAGTGLVLSGAIALRLPAIYLLLLSVLVSAVFFALVTWRSHLERDYTVNRLRPFVASQRLYEQVLSERPATSAGEGSAFAALCQNLLGARQAYLIAVGPQGAFAGEPVAYPSGRVVPALDGLPAKFKSPQVMIAPVDAGTYAGAEWAVPLWSERGLIGVLLLGPKTDGGLYTQEEIEIARASGERLIDARAGAEIARRLLAVQRERLAEGQVLDRRTRRVLHDDVLPELQAALLSLNGMDSAAPAVKRLTQTHRQIAQLLHDLPAASADLARQGLLPALRELVGTEWPGAFDSVGWQIDPDAERAAQALSALSAKVLFHAAREVIRNAARHARGAAPARPLHLRIALTLPGLLSVSIEDDGVGMAVTTGPTAGHGLALHSTLLAIVGGELCVESTVDRCTRVTLRVPVSES